MVSIDDIYIENVINSDNSCTCLGTLGITSIETMLLVALMLKEPIAIVAKNSDSLLTSFRKEMSSIVTIA